MQCRPPVAGVIYGLFLFSSTVGAIEPQINYGDQTTAVTKITTIGVETTWMGKFFGTDSKKIPFLDFEVIHALVASISVILVSELGDKTFFIAATMAMRHPRLTVFLGAMSALSLMTVLSAVFGMAATIIPRVYVYYITTALFVIFGLKALKDGFCMSATDTLEELDEVQSDLKKREADLEQELSSRLVQEPEIGVVRTQSTRRGAPRVSRIFMQAFTMTFLAEWGDKSQLTTIILSARENVYGVIIGGFVGHAMCTGLAVIGGRIIAQRISVRAVTLVGGAVFLLFAISALFFNSNEE